MATQADSATSNQSNSSSFTTVAPINASVSRQVSVLPSTSGQNAAAFSVQPSASKAQTQPTLPKVHLVSKPPAPKTILTSKPNTAPFFVQLPANKNLGVTAKKGYFQCYMSGFEIVYLIETCNKNIFFSLSESNYNWTILISEIILVLRFIDGKARF
jgi:hypothetical protein